MSPTEPRLSLVLSYLSSCLRRKAEVSDATLSQRVAWAMKFATEAFAVKTVKQITKQSTSTGPIVDAIDVGEIEAMIEKLKNGEKLC